MASFSKMRIQLVFLMVFLSGLTMTACIALEDSGPVTFLSHKLELKLDIPAHRLVAQDTARALLVQGTNYFALAPQAQLKRFELDGRLIDFRFFKFHDLPAPLKNQWHEISAESLGVVAFSSAAAGVHRLALAYEAEFYQDVSQVQFSNERVGREVRGTILAEGAFFSPAAGYYARGKETAADFQVTVEIPAQWYAVSDGNLIGDKIVGARRTMTWKMPFPDQGLMLMAAQFQVRKVQVDSISAACAFFSSDTALFDSYLPAVQRYLERYNRLIGPYPFRNFTVVENFFPTGYGMPGWTLIGAEILRLPFIVYTSLGHEVLHNWWGNGVLVDYNRGNWCESLTVYQADYAYKKDRSLEAAKAYRKNILKQYRSYIRKGNDFPIRQFQARSSPGTRTIGYNKAMMVFHYLEQLVGEEAFLTTVRDIYGRYRGQAIAWEEWMAGFQRHTRQKLDFIIPEWIDRAGAPQLALKVLEIQKTTDGRPQSVKFELSQDAVNLYHLAVPVTLKGTNPLDTTLWLSTAKAQFELSVPAGDTLLAVDPDFHLFRRLYPEEMEPIVEAVLGDTSRQFFAPQASPTFTRGFRTFAQAVRGDEAKVVDDFPTLPPGGCVILNPLRPPVSLQHLVSWTADSIRVAGRTFPRKGYQAVFAAAVKTGGPYYLIVLSSMPGKLGRLGQLVLHYGKYSYLIFQGTHNVFKGNWPVSGSPLQVNLN